jgi:hypothetical protein
MIRARVRLPRVNSSDFALGITSRVQNLTLVILRHGSLALYKVRQSFRRGTKFDIVPLLEANAILDARASPVGDLFSSYESRIRQHKMLNIKALRPSDHYFPSDIMNLGRRS